MFKAKYYILILILFYLFNNKVVGQTTNINELISTNKKIEITSDEDSLSYKKYLLVKEYRYNVLLNSVISDLDKLHGLVKNNYAYINEDTIRLFSDFEERLMHLIIGNYIEFFRSIDSSYVLINDQVQIRNEAEHRNINRIRYFTHDSLTLTLLTYISENNVILKELVQASSLAKNKKEFVILCLSYYSTINNFCNYNNIAALRNEKKHYLNNYTDSFEEKFIKKKIKIKDYSNIGLGAFIGSGLIIPTNNLNDYFTYGKPITFGLNITLNRFFLTADFGGSIRSDIKEDFDYKQISWRKGDKVTYAHGELLFGYCIYRNHRIGIIPYLGWSGFGFAPYSNEDKNYYENAENLNNNALRYGVDFQFKWGYSECITNKTLYGISKEDNYLYTTISLGYNNPNLQKQLDGFDGSLWYVKLNMGYMGELKFRNFFKRNWLL